jgi:hypothetical protein
MHILFIVAGIVNVVGIGCVLIFCRIAKYPEIPEDVKMGEITLTNVTNDELKAEVMRRIEAGEMEGGVSHEPEKPDTLVAEHEHKFTTGLAPGGKNLRICTVPGCGHTEGL